MFEYAFSLALLLMLMFGVMDFGRAAFAYHFVSYASHEASRWASLRGSACKPTGSGCPANTTDVKNFVVGIIPQGINYNSVAAVNTPGYLAVTTTWPGATGSPPGCNTSSGTNSPGCTVKVVVQFTFGFSLPYLSSLAPVNMSSTSQLTISQ